MPVIMFAICQLIAAPIEARDCGCSTPPSLSGANNHLELLNGGAINVCFAANISSNEKAGAELGAAYWSDVLDGNNNLPSVSFTFDQNATCNLNVVLGDYGESSTIAQANGTPSGTGSNIVLNTNSGANRVGSNQRPTDFWALIFAHEIGHLFNMAHSSCSTSDTVMGTPISDSYNSPIGGMRCGDRFYLAQKFNAWGMPGDGGYEDHREQSYGGESCSQTVYVVEVWYPDSEGFPYHDHNVETNIGQPYNCHAI